MTDPDPQGSKIARLIHRFDQRRAARERLSASGEGWGGAVLVLLFTVGVVLLLWRAFG